MANVKITELTALNAAETAATDVFPIVDVDADATKKISVSDLLRGAPDGTLSAPGFAFANDSNSGLYRIGTDNIALVTNGAARILIDATGDVTIPNNLTIQGATTYAFAAGTAAAPSITFVDDSDTGLYRPAANEIGLATAGTDRVRIDSSGNVGIGTTSPGENLHIKDTGYAGIIVQSNRTTATDNIGGIIYRDTNGINKSQIRGTVGGNLVFDTDTTPRLTITSTGNAEFGGRLLVGTTTEGYDSADNFTVADSGNCGVTIRSGASNLGTIAFSDATSGAGEYAGYIQYSQASAYMAFATNGTERMRIDSSGMHTITASNNSTAVQIRDASNYAGQLITATDGTFEINARTATRFTRTGSALESMRIDSSGNVLFGKTSQDLAVAGFQHRRDAVGLVQITRDSGEPLQLNRLTNDGKLIEFRKDTTAVVGAISIQGSDLGIEVNGSERMRIDSSGTLLVGGTSTADNDHANIDANGTLTIRRSSGGAVYVKKEAATRLYISADGGVNSFNNALGFISYDATFEATSYRYAQFVATSSEAQVVAGAVGSLDTPLVFRTASSGTLGERVRIDSSGNVKIASEHLRFNTSGKGIIFGTDGGSDRPSIIGNYTSSTDNNIVFNVTGSPRFTLTSTGSAEFKGSVLGSNIDVSSSSGKNGWKLSGSSSTDLTGKLELQCKTGAASSTKVFEVFNGSTSTSSIAKDGSATFTGNVGIGTTNASASIHLAVSDPQVRLQRTGAYSTSSGPLIQFQGKGPNSTNYNFGKIQAVSSGSNNAGELQFFTNNAGSQSERMRIDSSGNVGIGTTSPSAKLHATGEIRYGSNTTYYGTIDHDAASTGANIYNSVDSGGHIFKRNNTIEQMRIDGSGDVEVMQGKNLTWVFAGGSTHRARIRAESTDALIFENGSGDTERMRIDSSGRLLIGTTTEGVGDASDLTIENSIRAGLTLRSASTEFGTIAFSDATSGTGEYDGVIGYEHNNQAMRFSTASSERMRIDSAGNVVLKPTNPASVSGTYSNFLGFRVTQTNNQSALLGTIKGQGQSAWGGDLVFSTKPNNGAPNDSVTERMRINSSGSVGIGTSSPGRLLEVNNDGETFIRIKSSNTGNAGIEFGDQSDTVQGAIFQNSTDNSLRFNGYNNAERVRIDSLGRLLVGTSSAANQNNASGASARYPLATFFNNTTNVNARYTLQLTAASNAQGGPILGFSKTRSTTDGHTIIQSGDDLGDLQFRGSDGTHFVVGAKILASSDGTPGTNDMPGRLTFWTTADGASVPTEHFRIDSAGQLLASNYKSNGVLTLGYDANGNNAANDYIAFVHGASDEKMRLDGSGRLLIGGTSTADDDHANINANGTLTIRRASSGDDCIVIKEGSTSSLLIEASGNVFNYNVGSFAFTSYDNEAGVAGPYASLGSFGGEARITAGSTGSDDVPLVFRTASSGTLNEHVRIDHEGTTTIWATSAPMLWGRNETSGSVVGLSYYNTATSTTSLTGQVFRVMCDGDVENANNSYGAISDIELKENIVDARSQWNDLKALQIRNYNFKAETGYSTHTQIGLVAQETEIISPGLVGECINEETGKATKTVSYSVLYMKAVKALQEAMERIEVLEAKVNALEGN